MADEREMKSVFLSLSRSETEQSNGADNSGSKPFRSGHAFYRKERNSTSGEEGKFNPTESTSQGKDFSLLPLTTSLVSDDEQTLQKFLYRKLSKSSPCSGIGHISAIDLTFGDSEAALFLCYYCLIRQKGSSPTTSAAITADDLVTLGLEDLDLQPIRGENVPAASVDEFIVCLVAPVESQLDLFKADLDKLSLNLLSKLDFESSDVVALAKPILENWFTNTTGFLSSCVRRLGDNLKYLINAALTDSILEIESSDNDLRNDIKRFFECCSLSDLLSTNMSDSPTRTSSASTPDGGTDLLVNIAENASSSVLSHGAKLTVTLKVEEDNVTFHGCDCSKFCEDWSQALLNTDPENVSMLRHIIESYKLKAIQDMNTLKRLLKQAESDHYSLYKCYMFLKQCGSGAILLQHADLEMSHTAQQGATQVLTVLHEYISHVGGLVR